MKILMAAQFYPPINGGEERHVRNLAVALFGRGHDVDVLTIAPDQARAGTVIEDGIRVTRVVSSAQRLPMLHSDAERPHSLPIADPAMRRAAGELMDSSSYDIVHAHNWIVGSVLDPAAERGIPAILTLHDYSHVCTTKRFIRDGRECAGPSFTGCTACATKHHGAGGAVIAGLNRHGHKVRNRYVSEFLAVSSAVAERNGLADNTVPHQVIPNFIPDRILADVSAVAGPAGPDDPIVFVGDLSKDKGVDVLLAAYAQLEDPPPLRLAGRFAGAQLDLPPGAAVLDELTHPEVLALMASARCVVVPSVWPDPCPTVVLEAMAQARPVVAAASGGIVDMVVDGQTGYLVEPGDVAGLARALTRVIDDPEAAHRLGVVGRAAVVAFTDARVVPLIESTYHRVVALHHDDDQNSSVQGSALTGAMSRLALWSR